MGTIAPIQWEAACFGRQDKTGILHRASGRIQRVISADTRGGGSNENVSPISSNPEMVQVYSRMQGYRAATEYFKAHGEKDWDSSASTGGASY